MIFGRNINKDSRIVCMFQFSNRFAFYQLFVFQTRHRKLREFWRCIKQTRQLWRCSLSKENKILIPNLWLWRLQRSAVYNKVSEQRLDEEQNQQAAGDWWSSEQSIDRRPGSGKRSAHRIENVDTVESLLLSQEDKPQSHRTVREISREAGDPSSISFADIHKDLRRKCYKKRRAQQLTYWCTACTRYFRHAVLRDDNVIRSKPTWKLKHVNSILEIFEYFCRI